MEYITVGKKYSAGKIAFVQCLKNTSLSNIDIKDKSFLLIGKFVGIVTTSRL